MEAIPLDTIWKGATPGSVVDKKLKCQFELPTEVATLMPGDDLDPAAEAPSAPAAAAPSNTIDQTFITNGLWGLVSLFTSIMPITMGTFIDAFDIS